MKIVIFGNKVSTTDFIKNLILNGYIPDSLVTLSSNQKSKFKISGVDENIEKIALENEIEIFYPDSYSLKSKRDIEFFTKNSFDLGFCLGWQRLIPNKILHKIKNGVYGWHGSCFQFPHGRGRSPINWSIRLGGKKIYHNCFKYSSNADDGEVFDTKIIKINTDEYIADIQAKALEHIKKSSVAIINSIKSKNLTLSKQHGGAFLELPKLTEEDGFIQSRIMSTNQAINIVRSCSNPFPGAFLRNKNKKILRIWKMKKIIKKIDIKAGNLVINSSKNLILGFSDGLTEITDYEILNDNIFNNYKSIKVD